MEFFFLALSALCFLLALINLFLNMRRFNRFFSVKKTTVVLAFTFFATVFLYIPLAAKTMPYLSVRHIVQTILIAIKNTLQVFSLDADYGAFTQACREYLHEESFDFYTSLGAVYNVFAPIITFSFIISVFNNVLNQFRLELSLFKDVYIFSDLNEESVCLAKSCVENNKKALIVFTDVFENNEEESFELLDTAHSLGAITYSKDITKLKMKHMTRFKSISLFVIGSNLSENTDHAVKLIRTYKNNEKANIYLLFDTSVVEPVINTAYDGMIKCKIRKKNIIRSCVYNDLSQRNIFESSYSEAGMKKKILNVAIFGLGSHGKEWLKAYCWCAQIPDYELHIHVFDQSPDAAGVFWAECPELLERSGIKESGEAYYSITFHTGFNVCTKEMYEQLNTVGKLSDVYVCLGNDELCLKTALELRSFFRKTPDYEPQIHAVVYSPIYDQLIKAQSLKTYNDQERDYNIRIICSVNDLYSYDSLLNDRLEKLALQKHLDWYKKSHADEQVIIQKLHEFYKYNYYYNSSMASIIRISARNKINYASSRLPVNERNEDDNQKIRIAEHLGWNAFMRTEGYTYSKNRSAVAKTHYDLIPFECLDQKEQDKDEDFIIE